MAGEGYQKLTIEAIAKGFDKASAELTRVAKRVRQLSGEVDEGIETSEKATEVDQKQIESKRKLAEGMHKATEAANANDALKETATSQGQLPRDIAATTWHFGKLALAIRAVATGFKTLPATMVIVAGIGSVVRQLREEIEARLRLAEAMRTQGQAADELYQRQQTQQETLERIASRRAVGGFATPDISRRVAAQAARAAEQFEFLKPQDINQAFGIFGDVPGLSQRDLTGLAILASQGRLSVDIRRRTHESLGRRGEVLLRRNREYMEREARVETIQGKGMGWPEYRTGQPTELAQRILAEARGPAGPKEELTEKLKKLLPPEADIELAVKLFKLFGTAEELEAAQVEYPSLRPFTTFRKRIMQNIPRVEIGLPDQFGYLTQLLSYMGAERDFLTLERPAFEEMLKAFRTIQREGRPKVDIHNSRFTYPDAATQHRHTLNGERGLQQRNRR